MAQQMGTVIYACRRLPNMVGRDAVVIGQGPAGLFFSAMLRRMGASRVVGLDVKETRAIAAPKFGATHSVNNAERDALQAVSEITDGTLVDLVVEAAGEVDAINLAARLVRIGGHLLYFGLPRMATFNFEFWTFFRKYCYANASGAAAYDPRRASFRQALDWIAQEEIEVSPMLTHRFPFERVMEAYELVRTRDDGVIKAVVEMPGYCRD